MANVPTLLFLLLHIFSAWSSAAVYNQSASGSRQPLHGIQLPDHPSFNAVSSSSTDAGCRLGRPIGELVSSEPEEKPHAAAPPTQAKSEALKLHLKHRPAGQGLKGGKRESLIASAHKDLARIHTLYRRITEKKNQNAASTVAAPRRNGGGPAEEPAMQLVATLESGVSLGSGEYFADVFVGTPPRQFYLILDTGSDLNWIQCLPCHDCFEQSGQPYDPTASSSFRHVGCQDARCGLVSPPEPSPPPCSSDNQTCPYYYWYGDSSNTTGDLALETFTVNLTSASGAAELRRVENVIFGCGHWNRGLFRGAAGLLGLGRGPLSFSSQLGSLYGQAFSYCLVDRNSDMTISGKLVFGDDPVLMAHPNLNFTSFAAASGGDDTFYYVQVKGIKVGGEVLKIPTDVWRRSPEGAGGTIIDSGTTLSYFADPAYQRIREAFIEKVKGFPQIKDFPVLDPCFNVSGAERLELPEFAILFEDGAVWSFPMENYFVRLEPADIVCLAMLGTPASSMSILGNYQQQNFHVLYDNRGSRLGYAPRRCVDV